MFTPIVDTNHSMVYMYDPRMTTDLNSRTGTQTCFHPNNAQVNNSSNFGLKFFTSKLEAQGAYFRQKLANKFGFAPPVGRMFRVIKKKGTTGSVYWGYQTALATIHNTSTGIYNLRSKLNVLRLKKRHLSDIVACSNNAGAIDTSKWRLGADLHSDNVGMYQGHLVCIDFGYHCVMDINNPLCVPVYFKVVQSYSDCSKSS
jgi:spore germination protein YaaH